MKQIAIPILLSFSHTQTHKKPPSQFGSHLMLLLSTKKMFVMLVDKVQRLLNYLQLSLLFFSIAQYNNTIKETLRDQYLAGFEE